MSVQQSYSSGINIHFSRLKNLLSSFFMKFFKDESWNIWALGMYAARESHPELTRTY